MIKNITTVPMHDTDTEEYSEIFAQFVFASLAYSRLFIPFTTRRKNCQRIGDLLIHLIAP